MIGTIIDNTITTIITDEIIFFVCLLLKFIIFTSFYLIRKVVHPMPVFLFLIIIFVIWLHYENSKTKNLVNQRTKDFWNLEHLANSTRKSSIEDLDYIVIPIDQLPFMDTDNPQLLSLQNHIKSLSEKNILNLTGLSNTMLKQTYGIGNLKLLSSYDDNFTQLIRILYQWGEYLYLQDKISKATQVLEYAILCGTDISGNFILLAKIYKEEGNYQELDNLIALANNIDSIIKPSLITSLSEIKYL